MISTSNNTTFKVNDKVRVLRNHTPDEKNATWKTAWFGVIKGVGTTFALVWDFLESDSNVGNMDYSCEWVPYNSKILKIIKD